MPRQRHKDLGRNNKEGETDLEQRDAKMERWRGR